MSGIAEILCSLGYTIQGSDLSNNVNVQRLRNKGVAVKIGHAAENIEGAAVIVTSSAIPKSNPELMAARERRIPVVRRAEMLAELMRLKWAIAIGGTHGKTTTTSMVGTMLEVAELDPTVINGGIVNRYNTNIRLGESELMVVESDESDGTFTRLPASVVVVTNIDPEHLEQYGNFENLKKAYRRFVENIPFYGYAVLCSDHPEVQSLIPDLTDRRLITYGFNPQADIKAQNLRFDLGGTHFDVVISDWHKSGEEKILGDVYLPMQGEHNVQNALAAIAIANEMDVPAALIKKGLETFAGVKRRFTKTGEAQGVTVIDDYAHHPIEIQAVLKAGRQSLSQEKSKIIAVFQPHRYSRASDLFEEFCKSFHQADIVIVTDIYAAGETPIEGMSKDHFVQMIKDHGHRNVHALESLEKLPEFISNFVEKGDMIICMGAGDITHAAQSLPKSLLLEFSRKKQDAA